jgi:Carboxypeptidase regulatory-like domain
MRRFAFAIGFACAIVALPFSVSAQERASIVGVVQDGTGAIMPGVTVEASSPALIEQVRSAVTDGAGRYAIIDLRPGTYTVTFTLPGFRSMKREGIVLEGAFSAQVNGSLAVGAVEETVTVTGASPIVDTQSTQNQAVLNRQVLDVLPAARTMQGGAALVPGVSFYSQGFVSTMSIHGSATADQHIFFDGMNIGQNLTGTGSQANGVSVNELAQTELVYDAGSQSAENALGGVRMDSIPKEGGNSYSGTWRTLGSKGSLQNDNITDALRPFISVNTQLDYSYDTNLVFGGPIRKNTLWFLFAQRVSQTNNLIAFPVGVLPAFPNGTQVESGGFVVPHETLRLTWQATPRNKVSWAFYKSQAGTQRFDVGCGATSGNVAACFAPEASYALPQPLQYASQVKWTSPISNRVLLEVGQSLAVQTFNFSYQPEVGKLDIQHRSATTGLRTVASNTAPYHYFSRVWNSIANVSFVTGSHNIKVGLNDQIGMETSQIEANGDVSVLIYSTSASGVVTSNTASLLSTPYTRQENLNANLGLFAQDKWTLKRTTLTYGARYDYFNASTPEQHGVAGRFMSAAAQAARLNIAPVPCLPCWNDWTVRGGLSHDLFGNGKTALKMSVGKFLGQQALGLATSTNPFAGQVDTRAWNDLDKNGTIFDAAGNVQSNELGVTSNNNFGIPGLGTTQFDPALPRPTNWEESISVQHALFPRVSVTAGYYHRSFQHIQYTKNTLVDPIADYTLFNIPAPANANLPGGGGATIPVYNLNANKRGIVNNVLTFSDNNTRVYNGVEVSANARLGAGGFIFGGLTTERTATNNCSDLAASNPNNLRFCNQTPPFQPLIKASAGYTFPWDIQVSGTYQRRPGISIGSTYTFNSAQAGFAITGGGTLSVTVVDPTQQYYDYVSTLDARISKAVRFGRKRLQVFTELFNVPNNAIVLTVNETVGPQYFNPQAINAGRRAQFGAQIDW